MAALTYLDTHVVAWLFAGRSDLLPQPARHAIEVGELRISPMVVLELEYLHEIGRTTRPAHAVCTALSAELGIRVCDTPWAQIVEISLAQKWTRDPFDRLIVGHAAFRKSLLVTKDATIRKHYTRTVWAT